MGYVWLFQVNLCEGAESYEIDRRDNISFSFCRGFFAQDRCTEMKKKCEACPWESNVAHKELAASSSRFLDSWQTSCSSTCCINISLADTRCMDTLVWSLQSLSCFVGALQGVLSTMKSQKQGLADLQSFGVLLYNGVDVDEGLMVFSQSESVLVSPRIEFQSIVV